jgi:hypothetical protein
MAPRAARAGAVAIGALVVLLAPALVGHALAGRGTWALHVEPTVARRAAAPAAGRSGIPAVPAADRPAPIGVVPAGTLAPSPPVNLTIASIGVATDLERLGVRADGTLAPPGEFGRAGWYADGVEPGRPGPAVIAGHVDSRVGPAVFYRLGELAPGAMVEVGRADGSTVRFRVTEVGEYAKDHFPTAAVYGPSAGAELRLITCSGVFDEATGHYRSNLVVYATLA